MCLIHKKSHKYRAKPTTIDGIRFASKKESERYALLKTWEKDGAIRDLELQPTFPIYINNKKVCLYVADFSYRDAETGHKHVEDVKGYKTDVYRLKKRLVEAYFPHVRIEEV